MNDPSLRCPNCRMFDWYRDGFVMHEHSDGVVERRRVEPTTDGAAAWSCATCSYAVPDWTVLARQLDVSRQVHVE